jgi:hypothetical protein
MRTARQGLSGETLAPLCPQPARGLQAHPHQAVPQGRQGATDRDTINDATDFGIGKRLTNLPALREIGTHTNRRRLRVQSLGHDPITGTDAPDTITGPVATDTAPGCPGCGWPSGAATPCFRRRC